jgi:hypothetical protein
VESWLFEWFFFIFMDLSCRNIVFWCKGDFALGESLAKDKSWVRTMKRACLLLSWKNQ